MKMRQHRVLVENPHVQSLASLVLLCRLYSEQELHHWLSFRDKFIKSVLERTGKLVCSICGRDDLIPDAVKYMKQPSNLATIDHVYPVSKGGARFDTANCVIACYSCNQKKADTVR